MNMANSCFYGFRRDDGRAGVRNYIVVIPTVFCANEVASRIAESEQIARPLIHGEGCTQLPADIQRVTRVLIGFGNNPNVGGILLVGLGCEGVSIDEVFEGIQRSGKPVQKIVIQSTGGMTKTVEQGVHIIKDMSDSLKMQQRQKVSVADLVMGVKCGSSDFTSGLVANPVVGGVSDIVITRGGTVIFGETTELIGAEHIVARRGKNYQTEQKILQVVARLEDKIKAQGVDIRGSQPTPGNIKGGLTTIEEKSLGAIAKSGTASIEDVLEYGVEPDERGLFFMDSPGKESELMTGLASAGAAVILFTTGGGAPQGFPIVPVIKVASNPQKCIYMKEHIDVDLSHLLGGEEDFVSASQSVYQKVLQVASGELTRAEILEYDKTVGIYTVTFSI